MPVLDDIFAHLEAQAVAGGSTTWEMFKHEMPPDPDKVVVLIEAPGEQPEADPDATEQYDYPAVQVQIRGPAQDNETARAQAVAVYKELHDQTIAGLIYAFADSTPFALGLDDNRRLVFVINLSVMRKRE